ncbi:MAG: tRNA (N(6)-L-threonylcarbamoyladenosine(37)-C(2))-methylthiotransferase MtaB, partial [Lachnospiraceae bacterium]|nr:tRNA (N(6)-L-threonylcarbamoyladenosine(37)-C(2))-methylthiotransferase MtaB [Lachnospiraceae bacterium]
MKNVALHNLGCKVNSYEMDFVQQNLQEKGYKIVAFDKKADIYIVNTCSVTNIADRKSRQMLHRAKKRNPDAIVVAMGCYVQAGKEQALADPCIDLAIGNNRKKDVVEILERFLAKREASKQRGQNAQAGGAYDPVAEKTLERATVIDIAHTDQYEEMTVRRTADHTRAYIKIQDGCNQFCSY